MYYPSAGFNVLLQILTYPSESNSTPFCARFGREARTQLNTVSLSVSVYVKHSSFLLIATAVRSGFPQTRDLWKRASTGYRVGRGCSRAVSSWSRSPGCCGFRGVFSVGWIFFAYFLSAFFPSYAHGLLQVRGHTLPHVPLYE